MLLVCAIEPRAWPKQDAVTQLGAQFEYVFLQLTRCPLVQLRQTLKSAWMIEIQLKL